MVKLKDNLNLKSHEAFLDKQLIKFYYLISKVFK